MNKSESKYFNTALRMDEELIALLEKKDLEYITVNETLEMINQRFLSYFPQQEEEVLGNMGSRERKELVLVTREYLLPYLRFIQQKGLSGGLPKSR